MAGKTKILLVEDSPGDAQLTIMALKQADFDCIVDHVIDGVEPLEHLHAAAEGSPENRIDLVLLDINMPRMNGHETLSRIKTSKILKNTTVVMLTTSESSEEIAFCYEHGSSAFLSKLHDFDAFVETIRGLKNFWIGIVHGDRRVLAR